MTTTLTGALGDALSVIRRAAILVAGHWPVLLIIYLVGAAGHNALLWLAVWVSDRSPLTAGFILPLVPICTLGALILMLHRLTPVLRHVQRDAGADTGADVQSQPRGIRSRLTLLASTLVPFLTVYVSQGYLREDGFAFVNAASAKEFNESGFDLFGTNPLHLDRIFIATGNAFVAIIVIALVLRWLLDRFDLPQKAWGIGLFAAYVEVFWTFLLARSFSGYLDDGKAWVAGRRLSVWLVDRKDAVLDVLGPIGAPIDAVLQWFWGVLGHADDIVVIPIAWLTVGAVVYGHQIAARRPPAARSPRRERWDARISRVPAPARRVGAEAVGSVRGRFASLGSGLRLLAMAGLVPMLLFCLVFLVAGRAEDGIEWVLRQLTGPVDVWDGLIIQPYLALVSRAAYTVILVGLMAAAIDRILAHADQVPAHDLEPEPVSAP
jgi:uncharacterized membrane protein YkvA (DUF1232 family)